MLSLQEVETFLTVAECGSFSKAGQALHISQPTVSQIIQTLEARFRTQLFERHRRGVWLTDAGEALRPMAQELLTTVRRLEENMSVIHGTVTGTLVIGCSTSAGKYLLTGLIASFRQEFKNVRVDIKVRSRESVFERLISGQVDFGVSSKILDHAGLEYAPLFTDEVVLVVWSDHPWARFRRVYPDDLLDVPMIFREPESGAQESIVQGLREHDISPDMLNVVMELGKLVEVEVEGMTLEHQIHIARNLRLPSSRTQVEFWNFMQAHRALLEKLPVNGY
ncbi:MAG: LysR family transcriptional regulator [Chloroflexi bacterium]|nr:LysR family transcriptional regulator [Chloroflexota bacterium]